MTVGNDVPDRSSAYPPFGDEVRLGQRKLARLLARARRLGPVSAGASRRELVFEDDALRVYHYPGDAENRRQRPLLIVYSLINRPGILDLRPERSLIGQFRDSGRSVYLIEWRDAGPADRFVSLDDYVCDYLSRCVDLVGSRHDSQKLDLLGVCQGGTLAACYSALAPERVGKLITLVTPTDFHAGESRLYRWAKHVDFDRLTAATGTVSADLLNTVYVGLKPYQLLSQRYVDMLEIESDDALADFLRMEQWMYDSPDQAGEAFRQFASELYQQNRLIRGEFRLGGKPVRLERLTMPIRNVYATADHLVPPASSQALGVHARSRDYRDIAFDGGHLGVLISGRAHRELLPALAAWLDDDL